MAMISNSKHTGRHTTVVALLFMEKMDNTCIYATLYISCDLTWVVSKYRKLWNGMMK